MDNEIPEDLKPQFSEITDAKKFPMEMSVDDFKALMERLGAKDFDPEKIDGRHCWECGNKECLTGSHFQIVDPEDCDCKKCHQVGGVE